MADKNVITTTHEDVAAVSRLLDESAESLRRRDEARERFEAASLPSRVEHLWRFTNPVNLMPASLRPDRATATRRAEPGGVTTITMIPGTHPVVTLSASAQAAGLVVESLATSEASGRLGEALGSKSYFAKLNDAAWNTGLLVRAPAGLVLNEFVHVIVHSSGMATLPRLLVIAEPRAELSLLEEHRDGGEMSNVVGVTEVLVGEGARVRHVLLQDWQDGTCGHLGVHARLARDADLVTAFCSLGGRRAKLEMMTTLAGAGAHSEMVGVSVAADRQHLDHHTRHVHLAGHTTSNIDFKSVAAQQARSSYTGLIRIEADAREVEAFQENRNLLLSDRSRADSIPELEILNQDVTCSHGATVAPIDEAQIFYLQSRGLDRTAARRLVVRGFVENTLRRLPESLRTGVEAIVEARLDRLEQEAS